jgi:hypothetical protein
MRRAKVLRVAPVVALTHHAGIRIAEVAFLLVVVAGIWLAAAQIPMFRAAGVRTIVAGMALGVAGLLLIIAAHWGQFG